MKGHSSRRKLDSCNILKAITLKKVAALLAPKARYNQYIITDSIQCKKESKKLIKNL